MKCLYIAGAAQCSGASLALLDLILELRKFDIDPVVVLKDSGPFCELLAQHCIKFHIAHYSPWVKSKTKLRVFGWLKDIAKSARNIFAEYKVRKILLAEKPDIVHVNSIMCASGFQSAQQLGIPTVWHIREMLWEDHRHELINPSHSYALLTRANTVITISQCVTNKYRKLLPNANIKRIFDGLPVPERTSKDLTYTNTPAITLLLAGRISQGKGQLEAVTAISLLPAETLKKIKLTIIGHAEDLTLKQQLIDIIEQHQLQQHIQIMDFTHDIKALWRQADITLMCSHAEAFGRVTVEGMLLETVVIASDTGANPELIDHGTTGFLYKQGCAASLAETITYAVNNLDDLVELRTRARTHAIENFSIAKHAEEVYSVYRELMQQ